jgi:hypothetical protein
MPAGTGNISPIFPAVPKPIGSTFVAADGTTLKTLYTGGSAGSIVDFLSIVTDDTVANSLILYFGISGIDYRIGRIEIPAQSGIISGAKAISGLNVIDLPWVANMRDFTLPLGPNVNLRASLSAAASASRTFWVAGEVGDY